MSQLAGHQATGAHSAALNSDPSIASSALQKAIRRGDQAVALRAAAILFNANPDKLWRRLVVIAMEDIGIGDLDLVSEVLTLSGRRVWRAQNGGEQHFVRDTIQRLCSTPKSRDACDILVVADLMPSLASARAEMFDLDDVALTQVLSKDGPLEDCVLAAWYLAGTDRFPAYSLAPRAGNFSAVMDRLAELGAPSQAITAAMLGSTRTREGFPVSLPLVALYADGALRTVDQEPHDSLGLIGGWPSEAFDMHTRIGQVAIRRYLQQSRSMRNLLADYMAPHKQADFLGHLIFRLEGACVDRRVRYSGQLDIEEAATEAHLTYARISKRVIEPATALLSKSWSDLHAARVEAA